MGQGLPKPSEMPFKDSKACRRDSKLALVGLDAATTGRLAIVFYREYNGKYDCNELIDCIETWHRTCAWQISYLNKRA